MNNEQNLGKVLEVNQLVTSFDTHVGKVQAVRGSTFDVYKGEILGIVGESGSGKSVTALSIMRLLTFPGFIESGSIKFQGQDLTKMTNREMRKIRGKKIAMIFQDPMTSLNPLYTIGNQLIETIREHEHIDKEAARRRAIEMLHTVGIPSPEERMSNYPYEFSGGMRQRAMIAMALMLNPDLLIADEPTTALDVTIQGQILQLIRDLNEQMNMSTIFITHDLACVASLCSRIIVMYGGQIMEMGTDLDIFYEPRHPYTMGLLKSVPRVSGDEAKERLIPIAGSPPDMLNPPKGCPFVDRCDYSMRVCANYEAPYYELSPQHRVKCWLLHKDAPSYPQYNLMKGGIRNE